MKDMREADVSLGINIIRSNNRIILSQSHCVKNVLKCFDMLECSPVSTPMNGSLKLLPHVSSPISQLSYSKIIRSLIYAMTSIRPDIALAVGKLSRYTRNPTPMHWIDIRRVLKYLNRTMSHGICYSGEPMVLEWYSNGS